MFVLLVVGMVLYAGEDDIVPEPVYTRITVSAERGAVREVGTVSQVVTVVTPEAIAPSLPTLGHALEGQANILVQQTAPGQVSPFLRGLTGYHVLNLVDGVRFNNSGFRSGPNQYLAWVAPPSIDVMEAVLGPGSVQYGSDAMGGTISLRTPEMQFSDRLGFGGNVAGWAASADRSGGAEAQTSITARTWAWLLGASTAKHNNLRTGGGSDSRDVFRRFFGVSGLVGPSMPGTAWSRQGLHTKGSVALPKSTLLTLWYQRSDLGGLQGYKDLLGGLGRLQSRFEPQTLDFGYVRVEHVRSGLFESISGTVSFNRQNDGSLRQGQRLQDPVITDRVRIRTAGFAGQAVARVRQRHLFVFGSDVYDETAGASRIEGIRAVRALYPDGAKYGTYAGFGQGSTEMANGRVRVTAGGRLTGVRYSAPANATLGVASAQQSFRDLTWHLAGTWQISGAVGLHAIASRGFRAPNLNDLGAIGLNDLGYEIPASEATGALIGSAAGEAALPTGKTVTGLEAEHLRNYEAGARVRAGNLYVRVQAFHADLLNPVDRRTLLFAAGRVPSSLAGLTVVPIPPTPEQRTAGVVTVATSIDPRAVKAFVNDGQYRYYGAESIVEYRWKSSWMARGTYGFLHGRQLNPNRFVRRLPPQSGQLSLMYTPTGRRYWIEARSTLMGPQHRLNGGDLDDERIGASRSRRDIASFFSAAAAQPWISDGRFVPTGETLAQIQARVLPDVISETARVPLYTNTAGWARFDILGGFRFGERTTVYAGIENLLDRNYRVHGSGIDGPGINVSVRVRYSF
jgi:outer membrane receptor protein involved in Fe transport